MEIYVVTVLGSDQERDSNQQQQVYVGLQVALHKIADIFPGTFICRTVACSRVTLLLWSVTAVTKG